MCEVYLSCIYSIIFSLSVFFAPFNFDHAAGVRISCYVDGVKTFKGTEPKPNYTCAVSHDLKYLMGEWIYVDGLGYYYVEDLTNSRIDYTVDLYLGKGNRDQCISFGEKFKDVYIIK